MSYECNILKDSLSPDLVRLTTFEVVFPRFVLAEVNTHRILSRNSASSRAIPSERLIGEVLANPFVPEFNKRVKGMGVGAVLDFDEQYEAEQIWLEASEYMVDAVQRLLKLDVDKSRANRLLEPFMWHTAIISGTEWGNFFALRTDEGAQPEFRIIAKMMQEAYETNAPQTVGHGAWHLPLVSDDEISRDYPQYNPEDLDNWVRHWDYWKAVAVGRLARRSSYNRTDPEPESASIERHGRLKESHHLSPFEHVATPIEAMGHWAIDKWSGNFRGWKQYRKSIPFEHDYSLVSND